MNPLLSADPMEIASLGLRLRQVDSAVGEVRQSLWTSSPELSRWKGDAASAFRGRLLRVQTVLPQVEQAYDEASAVLLRYAAAVEDCQVVERRAQALRVEAEWLTARAPEVGPDVGLALRTQADRLSLRATQEHEAAAARAAADLRALARSAPRPRAGAGWTRFSSDLGSALWGQAQGAAWLGLTSLEAVAGNRAARDDLVMVATQSWRVWEPFVEVWQQLEDGRGGQAAGAAIGIGLGRGIRPLKPLSTSSKNLVDDVDVAFGEAMQEGRVRHLLDLVGVPAEPFRPGDPRIGLFAHEAMNGHAIRQHVAKSPEFLRWRADQLERGSASTFPDARTAQLALNTVVELNRDRLALLMDARPGTYLPVAADLGRVVGHGVLRGDPTLRTSTAVRGGFQRVEGGIILVSLYPKVG